MKALFDPPEIQASGGGTGGGSAPKPPPDPRPQRKPTQTDPSVQAASQRTRSAALRRRGRLSTILTDRNQSITGSSGQKLGA